MAAYSVWICSGTTFTQIALENKDSEFMWKGFQDAEQ